ncbi:MAG: hypothetical protein ACI86H_001213, partial [bacterium]
MVAIRNFLNMRLPSQKYVFGYETVLSPKDKIEVGIIQRSGICTTKKFSFPKKLLTF